MHSRKNIRYIITPWVMFLCTAILAIGITGCEKDVRDETEFAELKEAASEASEAEKAEDAEEPQTEKTEGTEEPETGTQADTDSDVIYVDVCGQVKAPGVYVLPKTGRVFEAVEKAGGMTEKAAVSYVNQAQKLTDGEQIYIPSKEEVQKGEISRTGVQSGQQSNGKGGVQGEGKVNLNTATKEELMTLSGIGEVKADAIIRYREEHGGFQSIEDIKKIEGIKDGVFNKVKDQIQI